MAAAEVQNLLDSLLDSFEDVVVSNGELYLRICKEVWTPFIGERLGCARESNREDSFAVAMKRGTETVAHVPRTISCICMQRGSISCEVTGSTRPSIDLSPF